MPALRNREFLEGREPPPRAPLSEADLGNEKTIGKAVPWVRWIQTFADERCRKFGVVYQASNFLYCGFHWTEFYELDGKTYRKILLTAYNKSGYRGVYLRANLHRAVKRRLRQFRYVYFIDKRWRSRLNLPIQAYPKPDTLLQASSPPEA